MLAISLPRLKGRTLARRRFFDTGVKSVGVYAGDVRGSAQISLPVEYSRGSKALEAISIFTSGRIR